MKQKVKPAVVTYYIWTGSGNFKASRCDIIRNINLLQLRNLVRNFLYARFLYCYEQTALSSGTIENEKSLTTNKRPHKGTGL